MKEVSSYAEYQVSVQENEWVLLYFSASWCGPCSVFSPIVAQASGTYKQLITTIKVDVEQVPEAAREHDIRSIPTLLLLHKGKVVDLHVGALSSAQLSYWLTQNIFVY